MHRWALFGGLAVLAGCEDGGQLGVIDPGRITIEQGFYGIGTAWYEGMAQPGAITIEVFQSGIMGGSVSADSDGFYEVFKSPGTYTICTAEPNAICSDPVQIIELEPHRCDFIATETAGDWVCD